MFFLNFLKKRKALKKDGFSFKMLYWLIFAISCHVILFSHFENVSYFDALWVTLTTVFTVGYGDMFARTVEGKLATMILIYGGGIFIAAKIIGDWFEYLSVKINKQIKGLWSYKMKNHIVIINHPSNNPTLFLTGLIEEISKDSQFAGTEIVLISNLEEIPSELIDKHVKWVKGQIYDSNTLKKANAIEAQAIYILANSACDTSFDSYALDIIDNLRANKSKAYIISECVKNENKKRLIKNGANAVIKVMHGYPGVASRALTVKGSQEVLENLFSEDNEECIRLDITNPTSKSWKEIVMYCLDKEIGTPIACLTKEGEILTSPLGKTMIVTAIFVIAHSSGGKNSIEMTWT